MVADTSLAVHSLLGICVDNILLVELLVSGQAYGAVLSLEIWELSSWTWGDISCPAFSYISYWDLDQ